MSELFWKVSAVLLIAALFYVGSGLRGSPDVLPAFATRAFAGVSVANDSAETVLTSSDDGRTVYVWRHYGAKPPKYLGKAQLEPEQ